MPRKLTVPLLAALGWMAAAQAFALTVPLKYTPADESGAFFHSSAHIEWKPTPPPGNWTRPEAVGDRPLYALLKLGDDERLLMLDREKPGDEFYNRLRFDANGDRDLTNDPVIKSNLTSHGDEYRFLQSDMIDTRIKLGAAELPCRFQVQVNCFSLSEFKKSGDDESMPPRSMQAITQNFTCYSADVEIDGRSYQLSLTDGNGNGHPGEPTSEVNWINRGGDGMLAYAIGDRIYIKEEGSFSYYDGMPMARWLVLGGKLFEVKADVAAGTLSLEPAAATATVELPDSVKRLTLFNEAQSEMVTMYRPTGAVPLPAGDYKLVMYQMEKQDPQGDLWRAQALGSNKSPVLKLTEGGAAAEWAFGEPFMPLVRAEMAGDDQARLSLDVVGLGREQLVNLEHEGSKTKIALDRQGRLPKEPTWQVVRADGERVANGSFEYG